MQKGNSNDQVFLLDEENYYKALSFLENRKKTSLPIEVETDKGIISLDAGKTNMLYLNGEPVGRISFNMYGEEEHIVTDTLYLPLVPPQEGAKPITWTLKKK